MFQNSTTILWNLPDPNDLVYQSSASYLSEIGSEIRFASSLDRVWSMIRRTLGSGKIAIAWSGKGLWDSSSAYFQTDAPNRTELVIDRPREQIELVIFPPEPRILTFVQNWLTQRSSQRNGSRSAPRDLDRFLEDLPIYQRRSEQSVLILPYDGQNRLRQLPNRYHEVLQSEARIVLDEPELAREGYLIYRDTDYLVIDPEQDYGRADEPSELGAINSIGYPYRAPISYARLVVRNGVDLFQRRKPTNASISREPIILHLSEENQIPSVSSDWQIMRWSATRQLEAIQASCMWEAYRTGSSVLQQWIVHLVRLARYGGISLGARDLQSIRELDQTYFGLFLASGSFGNLTRRTIGNDVIAGPKRMTNRASAKWYLTMELLLSKGDLARAQEYLARSLQVQLYPSELILLARPSPPLLLPEGSDPRPTPNPFSAQLPIHLAIARMEQDPRGRYHSLS